MKIFEEKGGDHDPESPAPYAMSSAAMKAVFDNLTLGAGRRAELEYGTNSLIHDEADSIEVNVKSARVNSQMHVTNWSEAQQRTPSSKLPWTGAGSIRSLNHGPSNCQSSSLDWVQTKIQQPGRACCIIDTPPNTKWMK